MTTRQAKKEIARIAAIIETDGALSWGELAFLNSNHETIKKYFGDNIKLLEWAGVPEFDE